MTRKLPSLLFAALFAATPATLMAGDDKHGSSQNTDGLSQGADAMEDPNAGKPGEGGSRSRKPKDNAIPGDGKHGTSQDTDGLSQGTDAKKDSDPKASP